MPPSSSGGTTVGEALDIMEELEPSGLDELLHGYLEASAVAFADRARYLGDPASTPVPTRRLLDQTFAAERACEVDLGATGVPHAPGDVESYDGVCAPPRAATGEQRPDTENRETTNLTVSDRWGNVVEYALTIEQTGGAGLLVPNRGFLLNNELTNSVSSGRPPSRTGWRAGSGRGRRCPRRSRSPEPTRRGGGSALVVTPRSAE